MKLVPREIDKLMIFTAARVAERRLNEGVKLNYPEAAALVADFVQEGIRKGKTVSDLQQEAREVLTVEDVLPGVEDMLDVVSVEGTFPDGVKLVSVHNPIQPKGGSKKKQGSSNNNGNGGRNKK
jgi:urease gamma subunit